MGKYYLRLEGVNHGNVIDDTDNLSTRRGGSLMILEAASGVVNRISEDLLERLEPIATGASIGLFQFEAECGDDAEQVRTAVEQALRSRSSATKDRMPWHHGTFVVDVVPASEDLAGDVALLTARNRWRQLCEPTVALHDLWPEQILAGTDHSLESNALESNALDSAASTDFADVTDYGNPTASAVAKNQAIPTDFCAKDRIRPATRWIRVGGNSEERVSTAVAERLSYGRAARQRFYARELGTSPTIGFTDDLQTLAQMPGKSPDDAPPDTPPDAPAYSPVNVFNSSGTDSLAERRWNSVPRNTDGKVAVFYVDGNRFGAISEQRLRDGANAYRNWSNELRGHHRRLLGGLIHKIQGDPTWQTNGVARLETLLWGGDEIMWVVPAWKGWELAYWFFSQTHEILGETMTYGGGLVFSHANAPIKNLTKLAYELADLAKTAGKSANGHRLAYEVLESLDDVTGELTIHRQRWLPKVEPLELLLLDPVRRDAKKASFEHYLGELAGNRDLPMRQLYLLCQKWRNGKETQEHRQRIAMAVGEPTCKSIEAFFDGSMVAWLHVLQMLPYVSLNQSQVSP